MNVARWMLLPLRLFLGVTFIYAGVQKLTDPQFFNPTAPSYIGKQIIGFASGSPLHDFLIRVAVPHAQLFGYLVAYGEIAIGLSALIGLLFRPAAFSGLLMSLTFYLSATFRVFPYFYGADIVFVFCWITLLIAGPTNTGLPSLDEFLVQRYLSSKQQKQYAPLLAFFLSVDTHIVTTTPSIDASQQQTRPVQSNKRPTQQQLSRFALVQQYKRESRRNFLYGALMGGAGMLVLAWFWSTLRSASTTVDTSSITTDTTSGTSTLPTGGTAVSESTPIAQAGSMQNNSAVSFTLASSGDPCILVHLNNGQFVAYDAVCTHAGCPVDYDPNSQMLVCPCHGAIFNPANNAAVVQGPAQRPLTSVPVKVDNTTGNITLGQ
jgi:thiosulfate dehydrogenase [quinone] large subunit